MLRQIIAAIFLFAFSMQNCSKAIIVINFYANQKEIAKTLCENKARPQMSCCGKCQLKKRLDRNDKAEQKENGRKLNSNADDLYFEASFASTTYHLPLTKMVYNPYLPGSSVDQSFSILRPPCS